MEVTFFENPSQFRQWLEENHDKAQELWVGYYKKASGKASITWPESVDQALCFGWIDGIRKSVGGDSYTIRFTPRRPRSNWSTVNINRVHQLIEIGLMQPAGLKAFEERIQEKSGIYSYERDSAHLADAYEEQLRQNPEAWKFYKAQPPGYQKVAAYWVMSAKKEETRLKRLATLIEDSASGRTIAPLTRKKPESS
ncbi:MAG: bacteriocin-protection protein [Chloroflexota bacterium]|nr:MAG: bacteriocin-protection protein [Chloroflexota bacterium]